MTAERWARITEVFRAALEKPAGELGAFLDEACGGDEALRRDVERLLAGEAEPSLPSPLPELLKDGAMELASGVARSMAARRPSLAAGQRLAHYEIHEMLGEGGMGVVWKAEDLLLKRVVALKFLHASDDLPRLLREAQVAASLNHPNICTVYEVDPEGGFLAMELLEGESLSGMIAGRPLPVDRAVGLAIQTCEGLKAAHDRGIIHRDIKSGNILVTVDGRAKILDFGLARAPGQAALTRTGIRAGTPGYMAPEQFRGEAVDRRTDIWAMGAVLHEMLTGRPPMGQTEALPEGVGRVVRKALAADPAGRYQQVEDMQADLRATEAIESASQPIPAAPSPPVSRRRWLWIGGGAATLAAAGAVGVLWWRKPRTYAPLPSKVPEANEYLKRALVFLSTQQDLPRGRQLLERSLELDPKFAYARAWYGFTHALLVDTGLSNDTTWLYRAEEELRRALQDDPNSARAHAALSLVYLYQGHKELLAQEARKTIEWDPHEREGPSMLAFYHQLNGDIQPAQALWKDLLDLDPLFLPARWNLGENLREMGDPEGSIREQEKVLEQDPKSLPALGCLAQAHITKGDLTKARQALEKAQALQPRNYQVRVLWALQLALEGKREEALREMDAEVLKYGELFIWASVVAEFYAVLGEKTKALDWLERAVRAGDERAAWFQRDSLLANVRDEPRFQQILDSIRYRRQQRAH